MLRRQSAIIESSQAMESVVGSKCVGVFHAPPGGDSYGYLYFDNGKTVGTHVESDGAGIKVGVPDCDDGEVEWKEWTVYPDNPHVITTFFVWRLNAAWVYYQDRVEFLQRAIGDEDQEEARAAMEDALMNFLLILGVIESRTIASNGD